VSVGIGHGGQADLYDLGLLHLSRLEHIDEHGPSMPLQQHPGGAVGHVQHLLDHGDRSHSVQLLNAGMVTSAVPLGHHKQALVLALGSVAHRKQGAIPCDVDRDYRIRKHRQAPQRQQRKSDRMILARHLAQ